LRSKDQGWQNVTEFSGVGMSEANDLAKTEPEPPQDGEA
jgi:hypothetical protein